MEPETCPVEGAPAHECPHCTEAKKQMEIFVWAFSVNPEATLSA